MTLKTKLHALLVAAILIMAATSAALAQQNIAYSVFGINGSGTSSDPYLIGSVNDWKSFHSMIDGYYNDFKDKYFKMTADISITASLAPTDMRGSDYFIGSSGAPFLGHFDGDNHTLTFNFTTTYGTCAPFRYVSGATIENLNVAGKITMSSNTSAGGIVANNRGNTTIRNCHSSIEIHGSGSSGNFGGLAGYVNEKHHLNIENCVFDGKITGNVTFNCGGFVGDNDGTVNITDCLLASNLDDITINVHYFRSFVHNEGTLNLTRAYRKFALGTPYTNNNQGILVHAAAPATPLTKKVSCIDDQQYWAEGTATLTGVTTIYKPSDGNAQLSYTATFDGETLSQNTHYTAQICNSQGNTVANPVSAAGDYTLTITGKGDYAGSLSLSYTVFDKSATPYIDADGTLKTVEVTPLTSSTTTLTDGWYAVIGSTTVADRINVSGDAHLILCDGQTLTASKGIGVTGDNSLTIYAQTDGTGTLNATGDEDCAGIGGHYYWSSGTQFVPYGDITINGGIINASGYSNCAGIGGAGAEESKTITINGGRITAKSASSGLGIGGGFQYGNAQKGGSIVLNYNNLSTRIYAPNYYGSVTLQKLFLLDGTTTAATASNIGDNTIVPCTPAIYFGDGNDGSAEKPYVISDADGWNILRLMLDKEYDNYKDKHYLLATDLSVDSKTSINQTFMGTFDGDGHTITLSYNDSDNYLAPFQKVDGAVFRNLRVGGTSITWGKYAGGIVGQVVSGGSLAIENCLVNVTLKANYNSNKTATASYYGGLVGYCASTTVNINGCIFCGSMTRVKGDEYSGGGFVGYANSAATINITDCIFAPAEITIGEKYFRTFGNYATINNSYYFQSHGDIQGKQALSITPAEGLAISFGTPTKTYNVSGITAYSVGMEYGGVFYAGVDDEVPVTDATEYPAFITSTLAASAGTLADGALTMPSESVTISATLKATFDGDTDTEISIPTPITVDEVEFSRTFTKDKYSTIVLPFEAEAQGDFCQFLGVEYSGDLWIANVSSVSTIAANTPYIYRAAQDGRQTLRWSVKTTLQTTSASTEVNDPEYGKWTFRGVYAKQSWAERQPTIYGFAGGNKTNNDGTTISIGDFVRAGANSSVKPFRCYLQYDGDGGNTNLSALSKSVLALPNSIEVRIVNTVLNPDDPTQIVNGDPTGDFETPTSELIAPNINVWSFDKTIYIAALPNTPYTIVDMSGRQLQTGITATDRDEIHISGTFSGIVIVRIANKSFKIRY